MYAVDGNAALWSWEASQQTIFDAGYALRQPYVEFSLPMVNPALLSGLSVYEQCGEFTYTISNPDASIFTVA
jgi:hypothetical protein